MPAPVRQPHLSFSVRDRAGQGLKRVGEGFGHIIKGLVGENSEIFTANW